MSDLTISGNTSTTWTLDPNQWLLSVVRDGDQWIVSEARTTVYGHGESLLHALCDFHAALISHLDAVPLDVPQSRRLLAQGEEITRLIGHLRPT